MGTTYEETRESQAQSWQGGAPRNQRPVSPPSPASCLSFLPNEPIAMSTTVLPRTHRMRSGLQLKVPGVQVSG